MEFNLRVVRRERHADLECTGNRHAELLGNNDRLSGAEGYISAGQQCCPGSVGKLDRISRFGGWSYAPNIEGEPADYSGWNLRREVRWPREIERVVRRLLSNNGK